MTRSHEPLVQYLRRDSAEYKFRLFCSNPYAYKAVYVDQVRQPDTIDQRVKIVGCAVSEMLGNPDGFHRSFHMVDHPDLRKTAAREEWSNAYAEGKIPILLPDLEEVEKIVDGVKGSATWTMISGIAAGCPPMLSTISAEFAMGTLSARPFLLMADRVMLVRVVDTLSQAVGLVTNQKIVFQGVCASEVAGSGVGYSMLCVEKNFPYTAVVYNFGEDERMRSIFRDRCDMMAEAQKRGWELPSEITFGAVGADSFDFCPRLVW